MSSATPAGCWSGPGRAWLASLELPAVSREVTGDGHRLTTFVGQFIVGLAAAPRGQGVIEKPLPLARATGGTSAVAPCFERQERYSVAAC